MSVAVSWMHLRSQVKQYKWNGTLHPIPQIPSAAFSAGWVIAQRKASEAPSFVLCLFCSVWQVGSVRVWTKTMARSASEAVRLLHRSVLLCKVEAVRAAPLFRKSHIRLHPQRRPPCWLPGHVARSHSTNVLLAPFLTRLVPGNDRCSVDQAGTAAGTFRLTGFTQSWWMVAGKQEGSETGS